MASLASLNVRTGSAAAGLGFCLLAATACTSAVSPIKAPPEIVEAAKRFDQQPKLSPEKSAQITAAFFNVAHELEFNHSYPYVTFENFPTPHGFVVDGRKAPPMDQMFLNDLKGNNQVEGIALAVLQPADAKKIAEFAEDTSKTWGKYEDPDLIYFLKTGNIPPVETRTGRAWKGQVDRIVSIARQNDEGWSAAQPTVIGSFFSEHAVFFVIILFIIGLVAFVVIANLVRSFFNTREVEAALAPRRFAAQQPPVWPPRRPDDWGLEAEVRHQQAVREYQRKVQHWQSANMPVTENPPSPLRIPSWEAHQQAEQARTPLQVRWAQTETGDWLRIVWGNRMQPPPQGTPMPRFQAMQRKDTGEWVWAPIPADNKFEWQHGPQRVEDYSYADAAGVTHVVSRPCGHPGYTEPPAVDPDTDTHGTARPLTDDELFEMEAAPSHGQASRPEPSSAATSPVRPDTPPIPAHPLPTTHGAAVALSDDDLLGMMGSTPAQVPTMGLSSPKPPHDPPLDPTSLAGIL